jgi:hypothetical protein
MPVQDAGMKTDVGLDQLNRDRRTSGNHTMRLKQIIDECAHLPIAEIRSVTDEFVNLVFYSENLEAWHIQLSAILGAPRKRKGSLPSAKDLEITAKTGGIRIEQTLFEKEFAQGTVIAKFWPWQDDRHITLRMAYLLKA